VNVPSGTVFEHMVLFAQRCEVSHGGWSALGVGVLVVDVAVVGWCAAVGCPAGGVPGSYEAQGLREGSSA